MENMVTNLAQYKGKRVFITGHSGFKGAWLWTWLHMLGAEVKGYSAPMPLGKSLFRQINGEQFGLSVLADILDRHSLEKELVSFSNE